MIVSLLFLVLLRFTAGVLFWIFIFGVIGIIGYGKCNLACEAVFPYAWARKVSNYINFTTGGSNVWFWTWFIVKGLNGSKT